LLLCTVLAQVCTAPILSTTVSLRSILISLKSSKHANREPSCCNHLDAFYLMCFARVYEIFTAVVRDSQHGPHVVL